MAASAHREVQAGLSRHPGVDSVRLQAPQGAVLLAAEPYRGAVDHVSLQQGLCGWLIDLRDPLAQVALELVVGDRHFACEVAREFRSDIWLTDDPTVTAGFRVLPESLLALAAEELEPEAEIRLRIAGQPMHLIANVAWPTVAQLQRWLSEAHQSDGDSTEGLALPLALGRLHRRAQACARQALRAAESELCGYVERVVHLDAHHTVVFGWTRHAVRREQSVIVVSGGRRTAAGLVVVPYGRDDLPEGASAFVGMLHGAWRAANAHEQSFFFLLGEQAGWLRTLQPLHLGNAVEMRAMIESLAARLGERRLDDLQRLIGQTARWVPTPERAAAAGVQLHLDRVVLVPGFGALVEGWLLSAASELEQLHLRVGESLLVLDPGTLQLHGRPDLAGGFPGHRDRVSAAGFRAVLRGPLSAQDWDQPMLSMTLGDGLELVQAVPPAQMRRVDHAFDLDSLATLYPAMEHEPWLSDFSRALREQVMQGPASRLRPLERVRAERMLVLALPQDASDLGLCLDALHRHASTLPADVGVALLIDPGHPRERVTRWCAALRRVLGARRLGLIQVVSVRLAFYQLHRLRTMLGMRRFAFIGPDVCLSPEGWRWLCQRASWEREGLDWLGVNRLCMGRPQSLADAQAFAWDAQAFEAAVRRLPFMHGGFHAGNGLRVPAVPLPALAWRLGGSQPAGLRARVNEALLDTLEPMAEAEPALESWVA